MPARKCSQRSSNSTPASENSAIEDLRVVGIRDSASQDSQGPEPCKPEGRPLSGLPHGLLEQLQNAPVLVRPTVRPPEAVRLDRIHGHLPALLAQLDQPLDQARGVLEVHVVVHHAVADEEPALDRKSTRLNSSHSQISYA